MFNPVMQPLGGMNPLNALNPGSGFGGQMQDWRALRPDLGGLQGMDRRNALMDWRSQMPQHMGGFHGGGQQPGNPGTPPPPVAQPLVNGTYGFTAPQNMVGANYNIPGASAPANPYQFPTYTPGG